jgi:hypothetical protein
VSNALTATSRIKLAKLLGMLGSDHAGERDAAVLAAARILDRNGLRWSDVAAMLAPQSPRRTPPRCQWRALCAELAARPGSLRTWERHFVTDLTACPRISAKQRSILVTIAERVLGEPVA